MHFFVFSILNKFSSLLPPLLTSLLHLTTSKLAFKVYKKDIRERLAQRVFIIKLEQIVAFFVINVYNYAQPMKTYSNSQKEPSGGVLRKRCSENIQQIYRRIPMTKCDFKKVASQLYCCFATLLKSHFGMGVLL